MVLTELSIPEAVLLSLELQVINLPNRYMLLDFLSLKGGYYHFHFKYDNNLKLNSRENKTAVKDSTVRI